MANAKLKQAWCDANTNKNSYYGVQARNLLLARDEYWREGLEYWCNCAGLDIADVLKKAREREKNNTWGKGAWWNDKFGN